MPPVVVGASLWPLSFLQQLPLCQWPPQRFSHTHPSLRPPFYPYPSQSRMSWLASRTRIGVMKRQATHLSKALLRRLTLSYLSQEDQECPLCLEEMDISDLNFKPCVCGYQVPSSVLIFGEAVNCSPDLSLLLAPHQAESEQEVSCVSAHLHR